jgi:hypothetical protein
MTKTAEYRIKIHSTKDKKKLKTGSKEYEYGTINIRDAKLTEYIGKTVKLKVEFPSLEFGTGKRPKKRTRVE